MLMSIAWLCDQGLHQCLSPGCVTTNLVFFSCETIDHLITWLLSEREFCYFITSRGWADSDQLILCLHCCVTTDQWSCWHMLPGCVTKITILSHVSYGREASDHLITCLSFRLSIGNFTIVSWLCGQWSFNHRYLDCMTRGCWLEVAPFYTVWLSCVYHNLSGNTLLSEESFSISFM